MVLPFTSEVTAGYIAILASSKPSQKERRKAMRSHEKKVCDDCLKPINEDKGYAMIAGTLMCLACLHSNDRRNERIANGECAACGTKLKEGVCDYCKAEKAIAP